MHQWVLFKYNTPLKNTAKQDQGVKRPVLESFTLGEIIKVRLDQGVKRPVLDSFTH